MSVVKSRRNESEIQFVITARNLQIYTIRKCVSFPKRYTFYISQPIARVATRIHEYAKCANSIYPTNQHEAQIRRDYLLRAKAELNNLISQIEVAHELFGLEHKVMCHWMEMADQEIRLVKGTLKKDRARYQNLP